MPAVLIVLIVFVTSSACHPFVPATLVCEQAGLTQIGDTSIVRMDGSGGKYYVTNDPKCGNVITSSAYVTSFLYIYLCGQCKGGVCPQVDGGAWWSQRALHLQLVSGVQQDRAAASLV